MEKALVVFSGGQDSTTCLLWAIKKWGKDCIETITYDYGQKHAVEFEVAEKICDALGVPFKLMKIDIFKNINDSAMVQDGNVSVINEKTGLPASFVPGRNLIFLTVAAMYAFKLDILNIVTGVCETDYSGYPDCRDTTIKRLNATLNAGFPGNGVVIHTPLMWITKAATWELAASLEGLEIVKMSHTCYNGNHTDDHEWGYGCGECPACILRAQGWEEYKNLLKK